MEYQDKEEINLIDYVKVLLKRKWLILVVFLGIIMGTVVLIKTTPKIYRVETDFEAGGSGDIGKDIANQIVEKINNDVYGNSIREKLGISEQNYLRPKAQSLKNVGIIIIAIESSSPQKAKEILEELNNVVSADYKERAENQKTLLENNIETQKKDIEISNKAMARNWTKAKSLEEEKKNIELKIETLEKIPMFERDPGTQFAFFDIKEKLEEKKQETENHYLNINALEKQINSIQNQINSSQLEIEGMQLITVTKSPSISQGPIRPKSLLNLVIASVLGLGLGTFLAFSKEWWEKNKTRI